MKEPNPALIKSTPRKQALLYPTWMNPGAKLVAQGWGTTLIAYAVGCWYVRSAGSSSGGKVMLLFVLLSNLALIVIHTLAVLNGVEKAIGWGRFYFHSCLRFGQERSFGNNKVL